jgi:hypothetical protein
VKTESAYTSDVLRHVRTMRPEAIVYKINDRTTGGILDAYIGLNGLAAWVEFKRSESEAPNIERLLTPLQKQTLTKMYHASLDAYVLVRTPTLWRAYCYPGGFLRDLSSSAQETAQWLINRLA